MNASLQLQILLSKNWVMSLKKINIAEYYKIYIVRWINIRKAQRVACIIVIPFLLGHIYSFLSMYCMLRHYSCNIVKIACIPIKLTLHLCFLLRKIFTETQFNIEDNSAILSTRSCLPRFHCWLKNCCFLSIKIIKSKWYNTFALINLSFLFAYLK